MEDEEEGEDAISMEDQGDENEDNGDDQTMDDEDDDEVVEISGKEEQVFASLRYCAHSLN